MHDCRKFREEWVASPAEDAGGCDACRRFCEDAAALFQVMDKAAGLAPEPSEEYWAAFQGRLRGQLADAAPPSRSLWPRAAVGAAAAIVIAVTWVGFRAGENIRESGVAGRVEFVDDHIEGLDSDVVDFLRQSELFLRSFTKIEPARIDDIEDAQARANRQLAGIAELKLAAGDFAPVRIALDEYDSVLREIKNLDAPEDLADIQKRIQRNGLIANLKVYQPRVHLMSRR